MRAVARAWRHAKTAQKLVRGDSKASAYLRAAGLAGVPNPGNIGAHLKAALTLVPVVGGAAVGLLGLGFAGSKLGALIAEKAALTGMIGAQAPALVTLGLSVLGFGIARSVKPLAKWSLPLFIGGALAALVQAIANIRLKGPVVGKDPTQPISETNPGVETQISLGRRLGLPIGEYTMGEYTATGDFTLDGTDDDASFDDLRGADDEAVFDDLSGIFSGSSSGIFAGN